MPSIVLTSGRNAPTSRTHTAAATARILTVAAVALALTNPPIAQAQNAPKKAAPNQITFVVTVDNDRGQLACALFRRSGWLDKAVQASFARIEKKRARCLFRNVAPGTYAISAFHDENGNGRLDTNFLGIPTEDWCTSRDASGFLGPPLFQNAKFGYRGGAGELGCDAR